MSSSFFGANVMVEVAVKQAKNPVSLARNKAEGSATTVVFFCLLLVKLSLQ